jgi:5,10-methylenetetrahydromethanopterin reductase
VSVELLPDAPAVEVLTAIRTADDSAIDTVFCVDEIYHRDAWGLLAAAARETSRVRLALGVAHVTLRDPLLVAQQLATLDELSHGRAAAAFSIGNLAMLAQFGRDPAELHPVHRMREAHRAMRSLLDTGAVDLDGEFFRYRGVFTAARPVARHVPLLVAAMSGPLVLQLAGESPTASTRPARSRPRRCRSSWTTSGSARRRAGATLPSSTSASRSRRPWRTILSRPAVQLVSRPPSTFRPCREH